jgi:hypothetical protein
MRRRRVFLRKADARGVEAQRIGCGMAGRQQRDTERSAS